MERLILAAPLLGWIGCAQPAPADAFTARDRAVVAGAIYGYCPQPEEIWARGHPDAGYIADDESDHTIVQAHRDYGRRNRGSAAVDGETARHLGLRLVHERTLPDRGDSVAWAPRMRISRPGYSRDGGTAIVTIAVSCGLLCGGSETIVLRPTIFGWRPYRSLGGTVF